MTLLKRKAEVLAFIMIITRPHLSNYVRDLALASDNMTRINIELGKRGLLSLESGKTCQRFFHDCRWFGYLARYPILASVLTFRQVLTLRTSRRSIGHFYFQ